MDCGIQKAAKDTNQLCPRIQTHEGDSSEPDFCSELQTYDNP